MDSYEKIHCEDNQCCTLFMNFTNEVNEDSIFSTNLKILDECTIHLYINEGTVPHFHLKNSDGSFECCVCIYKPMYFNHGKHHNKLSSEQRKQLDKFLRQKCDLERYTGTNWKFVSSLWEMWNKDKYRKYDYKRANAQPDYTNMVSFTKG